MISYPVDDLSDILSTLRSLNLRLADIEKRVERLETHSTRPPSRVTDRRLSGGSRR